MNQMQIYLTNPGPSNPVPMDQIRQSFQDWYNQGAQEDYRARLTCSFLGQADFTGRASDVATSDRHIFLSATICPLRSEEAQKDPYNLTPFPKEDHWDIIARIDRD